MFNLQLFRCSSYSNLRPARRSRFNSQETSCFYWLFSSSGPLIEFFLRMAFFVTALQALPKESLDSSPMSLAA